MMVNLSSLSLKKEQFTSYFWEVTEVPVEEKNFSTLN